MISVNHRYQPGIHLYAETPHAEQQAVMALQPHMRLCTQTIVSDKRQQIQPAKFDIAQMQHDSNLHVNDAERVLPGHSCRAITTFAQILSALKIYFQ